MKNLPISVVIFSALALFGCENYVYTFNEQPVFKQPGLFTDYKISDQGLSNCVKQAILDVRANKASEVLRLNCSNAGIRTLSGLEIFTGLTHINLDNNALTEIKPLLFLGHLNTVILTANENLSCKDGKLLANQASGSVTLPEHCTK